ncbi:MAG: EAL domain-containing protein [Actinomycetota bacterium]|nr:EAL domain-containing protein [Actinomycetota bacterium]
MGIRARREIQGPRAPAATGDPVATRLGDIAHLVSLICGTRAGYVAVFDDDVVRAVATVGAPKVAIPFRHAFCAHTAADPGTVFVIADARNDPRFADNPLVLDSPHLRSYAGAACVDASGRVVGTVAALGLEPIGLDDARRAGLRALAREAAPLLTAPAPVSAQPDRRALVRSLLAALRDDADAATVAFEMGAVLLTLPSVVSAAGWMRQAGSERDWLRVSPRVGPVLARPSDLVSGVVGEGGVAWAPPEPGHTARTVAVPMSSVPGREVVLEVEVVDAREATLVADALGAVAATSANRLSMAPWTDAGPDADAVSPSGVAIVSCVPGLRRLLLDAEEGTDRLVESAMRARIARRFSGPHRVQRLDHERWLITATSLEIDQVPLAAPADDLVMVFDLHGAPVRLPVHVGVAVARDGRRDSYDRLARDAERAAYRALESGRSVCIRDEELDREERIEADVATALAHGDVQLRYQPKVELATGRIVAVEALARWAHPVLGPVSPTEFVPAVERLGLGDRLFAVVLDRSIAAGEGWRAAGHPLSVAVNVSRSLLASGAAADLVDEALARSSLPAPLLVVEVTETVLGAEIDVLVRRLDELRALGVRVAIDDFGCGYSSLGALRGLPVDELKLDRTLLADVDTDPGARSIVEAVARIGTTLGLGIVAEGIEREGQARAALAAGCATGQGFLWGHAIGTEELSARLAREGVGTIRR